MKKYKFILVIVLLAFLITACKVQSDPSEEIVLGVENTTLAPEPTEDETSHSEITERVEAGLSFFTVENKIDEIYLDYSEHYELISNLENTKIRTHINQSIETIINKTKNNTLQMERALYDQSSSAPLQMEVIGNPLYFDDRVLSYEIIFKSNTAEGQENTSYTFLNYDLASGQTIKLKDLIPLDQLYSQIKTVYSESFEEPFNKDNISIYDLNQSFHFSDENSAVFVIRPYELTYEQKQFIKIPLNDIKYDPSKKVMIGAAIINNERIENTDYYEIFFSYPHFDGIDDDYSEINQVVKQHASELYDYGTNMAILDHSPLESDAMDAPTEIIANPDLESTEANDKESTSVTENQTASADLNSSEFDLPIYWYNLSYTIYTNNEKILSFALYDYQYTGGAHGLSTGNFYSYDLELGKQIEIKDLFEPKFDYITYINDRIYREIDLEIKNNPDSNYAYYDFSGIDEHVKFYIEDNELVIFFDQYEIAAYAAGTPTFRIPLP